MSAAVGAELQTIRSVCTCNEDRSRYVLCMATNPPSDDGHRNGAVRGRSQVLNPNNHWTKRDANTGEFIDQKKSGEPFKGVRKERPADESDEE